MSMRTIRVEGAVFRQADTSPLADGNTLVICNTYPTVDILNCLGSLCLRYEQAQSGRWKYVLRGAVP